MAEIPKSYSSGEVEARWYAAWMSSGAFRGGARKDVEPYVIAIPPPNVTGILTMGHVLNNTLQDVLIRRARLEGKDACWIPGTDHAGIATQTRVERELRKEGVTRRDLGRERFLEKVWEWRGTYGGKIIEQLKRLGCSADWERDTFTMDPAYSRAVITAFVKLFERGHIYRGQRMVNWCPVSRTALSDEEVVMKEQQGKLYRMRYEVVELPGTFVEIATTRPETLMGDTAVAVHPDDPRYTHLHGKHVWRPFPRAAIPIITDAYVDREFGSGCLKITPAHDRNDYDIALRHKLPVLDIMNEDGTLNALAGEEFAGMDRFDARRAAAARLRELGLLLKEEDYHNTVGYSERADVPIEPRLTEQWWLRYPRVEEAKAAVREGHITFHPERWSKVYLHWLENIQDWCISRQLWWGHRIPVWYRKGTSRSDPANWHVSVDGPPDPENWEQEEDVLDTWASSWLWPFATLGWPDRAAMDKLGFAHLYPTTTLVTGPDIIFFWVARMIMAGLEFTADGRPLPERIPFRHVYFTGIIRDLQGRKMSKSLGNSPDPLDLIAKYGADGLRFGLLQIAPLGQDIRFDEARIEGGRNFCNKLWNASRFRQMSGPAGDNSTLESIISRIDPAQCDVDDHALIGRLLAVTRQLADNLAQFEFAAATQALYSFFWNDFCDWYVEVSKVKVQNPATQGTCLALQDLVLRQFLLLFHPFAPFITEELWHLLGYAPEGVLLQDTRIPAADQLASALAARGFVPDAKATETVAALQNWVTLARQIKADRNVANRKDVAFRCLVSDENWAVLSGAVAKVQRLVGATEITRVQSEPSMPAVVTPLGTVFLDLGAAVDPAAERARLEKELAHVRQHIAGTEARLSNPAFTGKAPPAVIDGTRRQLEQLRAKEAEIARLLR
jgi:valyl-tRNA synthetase